MTIVETRLLDPGQEAERLAEWRGTADAVLVDAPCSGTGTWRRNPEACWRLTPARLARLVEQQRHVMSIATPLVRPGGVLVYVVCSLLDAEGTDQVACFLVEHPGWRAEPPELPAGRARGAGLRLDPANDGTDGFFRRAAIGAMLTRRVLPLETMMRTLSLAAAAALTMVCVSTSLHGQPAERGIDPRSIQLLADGRAARAAGNIEGATDLIETALTVDPRNRPAIVTLAELAAASGLSGKAIGLYREALLLDPNDTAALRGQGEALVAKGAVKRAGENLAKIRALCKTGCSDATQLADAVAKGPPVTTAQVTSAAGAPETAPTE